MATWVLRVAPCAAARPAMPAMTAPAPIFAITLRRSSLMRSSAFFGRQSRAIFIHHIFGILADPDHLDHAGRLFAAVIENAACRHGNDGSFRQGFHRGQIVVRSAAEIPMAL